MREQATFWTVLVLAASSCALPELTIDEDLGDDDTGGRSNGGSAGATGGSAAGGTGGGGSNNGGAAGQGGSGDAGKGGSTGGGAQGGAGTGGTPQGGQGGSAGTGGATGGSAGGMTCTDDDGCDGDLGCCDGGCVDTATSSLHCGACGDACPAGESCAGGECECPAGSTRCGDGTCVDTSTDNANCGACDSACGATQRCTGGTCVSECGMGFAVDPGGFMTTTGTTGACWLGYAWVAVAMGATATPTDFASCGDPCSLCVTGRVPATLDFTGFAMVGMNLAQSRDGTPGIVRPTGTGLEVRFTKSLTGPLRIQLAGADGETDANQRWCYDLSNTSPNRIGYGEFSTECWVGGTGRAYAREALESIMLIVPGDDLDTIAFDFCVDSIVEF